MEVNERFTFWFYSNYLVVQVFMFLILFGDDGASDILVELAHWSVSDEMGFYNLNEELFYGWNIVVIAWLIIGDFLVIPFLIFLLYNLKDVQMFAFYKM